MAQVIFVSTDILQGIASDLKYTNLWSYTNEHLEGRVYWPTEMPTSKERIIESLDCKEFQGSSSPAPEGMLPLNHP